MEDKSSKSCHYPGSKYRIAIVTSIHRDFDSRIWKYANSLVKMGHEVTLICPWEIPDGEVLDKILFRTFTRASARSERWKLPTRLLGRLIPVLTENDIVHFHDLDILPWMTFLALFKPVVYDIHENYPLEILERQWIHPILRRPLSFGVRWAQLACAQLIRNLVLVAESQERDLFGPRLRKHYVMNYASTELRKHVKDDYGSRLPSVIFTGSQLPNNGCFLYLKIASIVHKRRNDVVFYATDRFDRGDATRIRLDQEIHSLGLRESYKLLPHVSPQSIMDNLNLATIAISPNLRVAQQINGVHTKLFEYMAAGLPIVASDLPHQLKVVGVNNAGLLARPEEPESFAEAILTLLDDRELARSMGANGVRAFLDQYSWESQESSISDYYESILGQPGRNK